MKAVLFSCAAVLAFSLSAPVLAGDHGDGHAKPMYDCYDHAMCHGKIISHDGPEMCMKHHGMSVYSHGDHKCHELKPHDGDHGGGHGH